MVWGSNPVPFDSNAWVYNDCGLWFVRHYQASTSSLILFQENVLTCWICFVVGRRQQFYDFCLIWNRGSVVWLSQLSRPRMTKKANVGTSFCSYLQHIPPELICSSRVSCSPVWCLDFWSFSQWTICRVRKGRFLPPYCAFHHIDIMWLGEIPVDSVEHHLELFSSYSLLFRNILVQCIFI